MVRENHVWVQGHQWYISWCNSERKYSDLFFNPMERITMTRNNDKTATKSALTSYTLNHTRTNKDGIGC